MTKIQKYKTKKTLAEIKKIAISGREARSKFTSKELEDIEKRKNYYKVLMQLREKRKMKGLTQEQVSKKSGVPVETISRIENCQRNATLETVVSIADAIGVKVLKLE